MRFTSRYCFITSTSPVEAEALPSFDLVKKHCQNPVITQLGEPPVLGNVHGPKG